MKTSERLTRNQPSTQLELTYPGYLRCTYLLVIHKFARLVRIDSSKSRAIAYQQDFRPQPLGQYAAELFNCGSP
ncbi:hypothetical protein [Thermoleptolyngbya sp.]